MTDVEARLRSELAELADALLADRPPAVADDQGVEHLTLEVDDSAAGGSARWLGLVAACAVLVAAVAGLVVWRGSGGDPAAVTDGDVSEEAEAVTGTRSFGTWEPIADAPIESRSFPVAGWVGGEVVVWAGSSPNRGFAYTDGAAYDPATDEWRVLDVPGWGHPGLTAAVVDDRIVALAKGSVTEVDPNGADWTELPGLDGVLFVRLVSDGRDLFALGGIERPAEESTIAVARYDADAAEWIRGADLPLGEDAVVWDELWNFSTEVVWSGDRVVVWGDDGASAYDPERDGWSTLPPLTHPDGRVATSTVAGTDVGLVAVAAIVEPSGRTSYRTARFVDGGWSWARPLLPTVDLEQVTLVPAGEWLVMFEPDLPPVTVHVPSGGWEVHLDGPLGGLTGAAAVWTGSELVVWGGSRSATSTVPDPVIGARWTPSPAFPESSCREPAEAGGTGLVGMAFDELLPTGARPGYEIGTPTVVVIEDGSFVDEQYLVVAPVGGGTSGIGIWVSPDEIAAEAGGGAHHLYAVNDLAREASTFGERDLPQRIDAEALAAACFTG